MSNTTDQKPDAPTTTLAAAQDAEQMDLPIGIYGQAKYGECRSLTKEEIAAEAGKTGVPVEKTEA